MGPKNQLQKVKLTVHGIRSYSRHIGFSVLIKPLLKAIAYFKSKVPHCGKTY